MNQNWRRVGYRFTNRLSSRMGWTGLPNPYLTCQKLANSQQKFFSPNLLDHYCCRCVKIALVMGCGFFCETWLDPKVYRFLPSCALNAWTGLGCSRISVFKASTILKHVSELREEIKFHNGWRRVKWIKSCRSHQTSKQSKKNVFLKMQMPKHEKKNCFSIHSQHL